ncbi:MAG: hypothetical protein QOD74_1265 [Variibacter sp.]|jgi:hypothetical protein|nr:hypothetical protein [Variibacter sp.]
MKRFIFIASLLIGAFAHPALAPSDDSSSETFLGPPNDTFETGYDSPFLPQVRYNTHSNAICCEAGAKCNWYLDKDGSATPFRAFGKTTKGILQGPTGNITSREDSAPTMTSADSDKTYTLRLFASCGYPSANGTGLRGSQILHSMKVHVNPQCKKVAACSYWYQPQRETPCCVQGYVEQCTDCCSPRICG